MTSKERYQRIRNDPIKYQLLKDHQNEMMHKLKNQVNEIVDKIGRCERCGFTDERTFELHRVDGAEWPKNYYRKLREIRDGTIPFLVLCANCHSIIHNAREGNRERHVLKSS